MKEDIINMLFFFYYGNINRNKARVVGCHPAGASRRPRSQCTVAALNLKAARQRGDSVQRSRSARASCWPHVQSWPHQDAVVECAGTRDTDVQVGPEDRGDTSFYMCLHTDV